MTTKLIAAALTLAAFSSSAAFASDAYPGAMCQQISGGTRAIDTDGHVENTSSSSTLVLLCPIVDSAVTSPPSATDLFVTDLHYSSNITCDSRVKNVGPSVVASAAASTTGTSSSYQTISLTPPAMGYTFTHRFNYCTVPATYSGNKSEVRTYRY